MSVFRYISCSAAFLLAACSGEVTETPEYQGGYEVGYNDGYEEAKAEYSAKIEDALAALSDARVELNEAQDAAQEASREADRFSFDDWEMVVGDVQFAASRAVSETDEVAQHLDEAESFLSD